MDNSKTTTKPTRRQTTVRVNGKRMVVTTTEAGKTTVKPALPEEWELQAAQMKRLHAMPEYGTRFLTAGDQNSAKRGRKASMQAKAAGLAPGEPDVRIWLEGGRVGLIENKVGKAALEPSQVIRHPLLAALGHPVEVVRAVTCEEAADKAEALVRGWLATGAAADNDNHPLLDANARGASYRSSGAVCGSGAARRNL